GDVAAPRPAARDGREHLQVRERDRIAHPPPLGEPQGQHGRGDDEQRQEEERVAEAHLPPAQIAETWTIARTRPRAPPLTTTVTWSRARLCRVATAATSRAAGGFAV